MIRLTDQKGFTLIEIIVVLVIMGLMLTIGGMPAFETWTANMHIRGAADDLRANMQRARVEAIKQNSETAIIFDPVNNKYDFCTDSGDGDWATPGDNSIAETVYLSSYGSGVAYGHGNIPAGNSATTPPGPFFADDISYTANRVVFNSRGTGSAGYVYLDNQRQDRVYAVGTQSSGNIVARRWNGSDWE